MIEAKNVIFPMMAGDLVVSAVILGVQKRGDGAEMRLLEVTGVDYALNQWATASEDSLHVEVQDQITLERGTLTLHRDTPLLICNITRS